MFVEPIPYKSPIPKAELHSNRHSDVAKTRIELRKKMTDRFISVEYDYFVQRFLPVSEGQEEPDFTGLFDTMIDVSTETNEEIYNPFVRDYISIKSSVFYTQLQLLSDYLRQLEI